MICFKGQLNNTSQLIAAHLLKCSLQCLPKLANASVPVPLVPQGVKAAWKPACFIALMAGILRPLVLVLAKRKVHVATGFQHNQTTRSG